jgi:hypothetical protein
MQFVRGRSSQRPGATPPTRGHLGVLGDAKLHTSSPDERMTPDRTGSARGMEHEFTIPARVVEVTEAPQEIDPDTGELLPPAPAATDDGTPVSAPAKPDDDRSS